MGAGTMNERSFVQLKKALEGLRYREPLGLESAVLVQRLVTDLSALRSQTSDLEEALELQSQELVTWQHQVAPLRKENARLLRENNQLHASVIHSAEDADERAAQLE